MGEIINLIFGGNKPPAVTPPSPKETTAQIQQKEIIGAEEKLQRDENRDRQRIITARSAGPQTLLTRRDEIPKAVKLGGETS